MGEDGGHRAMTCLSAIREGRRWFDQQLLEHMATHFPRSPGLAENKRDYAKEEAAEMVRGDNAYHVAEFFYVARELSLLRRERLRLLIARHNADMEALLGTQEEAIKMGLDEKRVRDAIFSPQQQRKIFDDQEEDAQELLRLDQSDLGKLLSPLMSPESCRKIVVTMAKGGLLKTRGAGRVFVSSPGILEGHFHQHLLIIDRAMRDPA